MITDFAAAGYLILIPAALWMFGNFIQGNRINLIKPNLIINIILAIFVCFIEVVSLPLYAEWGTTFNLRAAVSAASPGEAATTFFDYFSWKWLILFAAECAFVITGFYFIHKYLYDQVRNKILGICLPLVFVPLLIFGIRGGTGNFPINSETAFYSHNQSENYMAVNKTFYFISTLKQKKHLDIVDINYNREELAATYTKLYNTHGQNNSKEALNSSQPNIVLIILEGCPAEAFEPLGGEAGISPCFTKLCSKGLLFKRFYASGFRTDQGLLSILSGIPALPYLNIMADQTTASALPSLIKELNKNHYLTAFIYGGNADFSGIRSYFESNNTQVIIDKTAYTEKQLSIEWGAPDNELFNMATDKINEFEEPFFACILTQSTHTPFELEGKHKYPGKSTSDRYKSTVYFTDSCIGNFIDINQNAKWFDNTIFLITSDHGCLYLGNLDFNDHERFRIPLLLFGEALKVEYCGKSTDVVGSSHDIPATLLSQLKVKNGVFPFSKDLFNAKSYNHAYWITDHTMGWITNDRKIVFNFSDMEIYNTEGDTTNNRYFVIEGMQFYKLLAEYILLKKQPDIR